MDNIKTEEDLNLAAEVEQELVIEELEDRTAMISGGCATSSSCSCSSSSCIVMA